MKEHFRLRVHKLGVVLTLATCVVSMSCTGRVVVGGWDVAQEANTDQVKFFRQQIEPIFKSSCHRCHGDKKQESGLRLDSRDALLKGGDNGPAIVAGKPDESLLLKVLDYTGDIQMPPDAKLDSEKIDALRMWILQEAPWPKE